MSISPIERILSSRGFLIAGAFVLSIWLGLMVSKMPLIVFPIASLTGLTLMASLGRKMQGAFLGSVTGLMIGYMFLGKGFAYFGLAPLYVGEIILALGFGTVAFAILKWRFSFIDILISLFMLLGLMRTLPYIQINGLDAVRDAALWYYAAFAILLSQLLTHEHVSRYIRVYALLSGTLVIWMLLTSTLLRVYNDILPHYPGSPVPFVYIKAGDRAVVLAGLAAFAVVGLGKHVKRCRLPYMAFWAIWLAAALVVSIESRGALLGLSAAMLLLILTQPIGDWIKFGTIGAIIIVILMGVNPTFSLGGTREISFQQLAANITSVFSDTTEGGQSLQGTKNWRLDLWGTIYNDTVHGPKFWMGDGFGANIPALYGFSLDSSDDTVRSPHSTHIAVLARMGVPGALLWIALQSTFFISVIRSIRRSRYSWHSSVLTWILAMWMTAIVNTSFETQLESPQGAIPFWCVLGAGIAVMRMQREERLANVPQVSFTPIKFHAHP